ncbi:PREDICTED: AT-rich interactive domain-containing protein 6-like isoform X3 [Camelina sativa]|uniref:AT-rich interactive domain-containing protein 6-like isoform X1 n=1 Tax=Camelina sativa TaxID=90675 RepID=A0ABM0YBH8_CAMSA|nr:PREDICTED: AT-rich interactive domain-containing protein 6-like isoform X1 [Camelina sativa]XP_010498535.1 PREDICTED: AT-rich interactive domain-containing protein 6-like isoform X2 [Camelina sativa]XP_010498536.1 PREDICTED: AT-rich interactive domain-containing protein 6-like isoform X3 [Camelina sativa]
MADTEMHEQDAYFGEEADLVDTQYIEEDPLETGNYQNPSETPQPLLLGVPLESDAHLANGGGQVNGHGVNGDVGVVDRSERKTRKMHMLSPPKTEDENAKKRKSWLLSDSEALGTDEAGTPQEQLMFLRELETFHKEHFLDFKAPKFYGQPLNTLKLFRAVTKLGGYEVVTTSKLWRQVGESFHPPKTCTTVSYTFRVFYEKALLEYEKYLRKNGELNLPGPTLILSSNSEKEASSYHGSGSGRARRDSAARAMQGWHAQRLGGSGEFTAPTVKDKGLNSTPKHKKLKSIGMEKHKTLTSMDLVVSNEADKQSVAEVVDVGPLADWVKINVKETKDCFEIFALVPGLLRKEVRIQSDPVGKVVITGEPEQLDNPWGITPFKKIVDLSARIDPLKTSAVMSMHGRLFIRAPFEQ